MVFKLDLNLSSFAEGSSYNKNFNSETIACTLIPSHSTGADLGGGCRRCIRFHPPRCPVAF